MPCHCWCLYIPSQHELIDLLLSSVPVDDNFIKLLQFVSWNNARFSFWVRRVHKLNSFRLNVILTACWNDAGEGYDGPGD